MERANREGILLIGNSAEPKALDHQLVTGVPESNIIRALFEGLVADDPQDDAALPPGAAERWEHNPEQTEWVFHLQVDGRWSDGEPVTAADFVFSYHRILNPDFAGPYADMLYALENAEDYNRNRRGRLLIQAGLVPGLGLEDCDKLPLAGDEKTDREGLPDAVKWADLKEPEVRVRYARWKGLDALEADALDWLLADPAGRMAWPEGMALESATALLRALRDHAGKDLFEIANIGVKAEDDRILRLRLREPVPYLPSLVRHYTWFPVPRHVVLRHGKITDRFTRWSVLPNLVGNGPFRLRTWRFHDRVEVERNPHYWDAAAVSLNGIRFFPIENSYTETRAFLSGQLHSTYAVPSDQIRRLRERHPEWLRQEPYVGTVFIRLNTKRPGLSDARVRQALSLTIEREPICQHISEGYTPATSLTPRMGAYHPEEVLGFDPEEARRLLAEAGYPDGKGFPRYSILISRPAARALAEAVQAMWKKHLNILVEIKNMDWGSYISAQQSLDFDMASAGWIGDYLDPTTFLNMWTEGNGNNNTGWHDPAFEALLREAAQQADSTARYAVLRRAERILMDARPILPVSFYSRNYLHRTEVKGWYPLLLDNHPWKAVRIEP